MRRKSSWIWILLSLALAVYLGICSYLRSAKVPDLKVDAGVLENVDDITFEWADGSDLRFQRKSGVWEARRGKESFEPDASVIEAFLPVFNLWELSYIPSDSLRQVWLDEWVDSMSRLVLRSRGKKVLDIYFCGHEDALLVKNGHSVYPMTSPWQSATWKDYFRSSLWHQWRNRMMVNWDYNHIAEVHFIPGGADGGRRDSSYCLSLISDGTYHMDVHGGESFTVPTDRAQAYLSAFRQVYFDDYEQESGSVLADPKFTIRIVPMQGDVRQMDLYEKRGRSGQPDIFKAVVLFRSGDDVDTVELSYVVLDKMLKSPSWFRRER